LRKALTAPVTPSSDSMALASSTAFSFTYKHTGSCNFTSQEIIIYKPVMGNGLSQFGNYSSILVHAYISQKPVQFENLNLNNWYLAFGTLLSFNTVVSVS
jgi:hypothetical protein